MLERLLETLCATGIRVSELQYITVEAARNGVAEIALKGKIRTILLPTKLCRKLLKYAKKRNSCHGQVFLTKKGNGLSRKFIWAEMKKPCEAAKVARSKVFPHNLRGLFARTFYAACRVRSMAGGRAGSQQHRDDPHLPAVHGKRKRPPAGQTRSAQRVGIIIISCNLLETVK